MIEPEASAGELVAALRKQNKAVAIAESCTGGQVVALLTGVPGSSMCVWGGAVVYTAAAKESLAGVDADYVARYGEVSEEVTEALAAAIRRRAGTEIGAAVTGWAGPTANGSDPVGTVYLAVDSPAGTQCRKRCFEGSRNEVRRRAAAALLELLLSAVRQPRVAVGGGQAE